MTPRPARLPAAFDALLNAPPRAASAAYWLPLALIALLVLMIGALFVALVLEDRQLQRDALARDADSAAQQVGARIIALNEVLSTTALEIGSGALQENRFAGVARDLIAAKPELQRLELIDPERRVRWVHAFSLVDLPRAGTAIEPALADVLERAGSGPSAQYTLLDTPYGPLLVIAVPVYAQGRYTGTVIGRVGLRELLVNAVTPELIARYRLSIVAGGQWIASTSASPAPQDAATYALPVSPLPPEFELQASAFERSAPLQGSVLVWVVIGLGAAVAIALGVLAHTFNRQVRIDRALLAEASLRRAMEQSLATGLLVLDPQGTIRYVNRAFCQMTRFAEAELVGRTPPFPHWPPELHAELLGKLQSVLAGQAPAAGFEMEVRRSDGSRFDARVYASPLVDDAGGHIGWMTSMADVTEPRRIRNELAAAHERFLTVLESLDAAVSVSAPAGDGDGLLFANREYRDRFGDGAGGHDRLAAALRAKPGGEPGAEVYDDATGRWFDVRVRAIRWPTFLGDMAGRTARLQIASDITLRKTTEDIVREQQEKVQFTARLMTLGEMASSLAHELNQPLTAITNYSEGLLARRNAGPVPDDALRAALEKTSAQAQRAGNIIRRIREFVRRSEPRRRPTPAARVIEDAIGFAEIEAAKRRISIAVEIDPSLPPLLVDPILIEQVLLNLLKNALDAMEQATVRRVDVRARRAEQSGMAVVEVIDRGSGIPEEHLPNLFQPFFSTKNEGMGMGLKICRSIVEFHQGRLAIERNSEPAGGTVMRFTLPLAAEAPAATAGAAAADAASADTVTESQRPMEKLQP
jgi:PAS domain S-box-containing protein